MKSGNFCLLTLLAPDFDWRADAYLSALAARDGESEASIVRTVKTVDDAAVARGEFAERALPGAARFLCAWVLRGLVPDIETELLEWRKGVKGELKAAKAAAKAGTGDAALVGVLDARQLSIKLICNSLYGFFGSLTSSSFCLEVADSVTRWGRTLIEFARWAADHVANELTLEHPVARRVASFTRLKTKLLDIPDGEPVVRTLVAELRALRDAVPRDVALKERAVLRRVRGERAADDGGGNVLMRALGRVQTTRANDADLRVRLRTVYGDTGALPLAGVCALPTHARAQTRSLCASGAAPRSRRSGASPRRCPTLSRSCCTNGSARASAPTASSGSSLRRRLSRGSR